MASLRRITRVWLRKAPIATLHLLAVPPRMAASARLALEPFRDAILARASAKGDHR